MPKTSTKLLKRFKRNKTKKQNFSSDKTVSIVKPEIYETSPEEISKKRREEFQHDPDNPTHLGLIIEEINCRFGRTKQDIYTIGELLTKSKSILPHGQFQSFVEDNFEFSYQTANNMMNVYACCAGNPDVVRHIKSSVLYKLTSKTFPDKLREYILSNADILNQIDNKTIADIGQKFASGELDLESEEVKELLKYNDEKNEEEYYNFEVNKCIDAITKTHNILLKTAEKLEWPVLHDEDKPIFSKKQKKIIKALIDKMNQTITNLCPIS